MTVQVPKGAHVTAFIDGLPDFTIGAEEEYLIVDPDTRDLVANPPRALLHECAAAIAPEVGSVSPELLRSQIEVGTSVCGSIAEVRERLAALRGAVAETVEAHELRIVAASTHPFALWSRQLPTDKERYRALAEDMQALAQRMVIGGMHVHVGIPNPQDRIDVLNQITYFLPHLLALSTSSPFWQGRNTGLRSYRRTIIQGFPRTGLPERFASYGEYQRMIQSLLDAGLIDDPTQSLVGRAAPRQSADAGDADHRRLHQPGGLGLHCGAVRVRDFHAGPDAPWEPAVAHLPDGAAA